MLKFLSVPGAAKSALISPPSYYRLAADNLLPPVVKLAKSRSAVLETELDAVLRARTAGASNDEVRALVQSLVAKRAELAGGNAA